MADDRSDEFQTTSTGSVAESVSAINPAQIDPLPQIVVDPTGVIRAVTRFSRAHTVTVTIDVAMDGWRMELWGADRTALGLWPIPEFDGVSSESYALITTLLDNVGLADDGPSGWSESEGRWSSAVHPGE